MNLFFSQPPAREASASTTWRASADEGHDLLGDGVGVGARVFITSMRASARP